MASAIRKRPAHARPSRHHRAAAHHSSGCGGLRGWKKRYVCVWWGVGRSVGYLCELLTWGNANCSCVATQTCPNQTQTYRWFGRMDGAEGGFGPRLGPIVLQWTSVEAFSGYGWLQARLRARMCGWLRVWFRCRCLYQPFRGFAGSRAWLRVSRGTVAESEFV